MTSVKAGQLNSKAVKIMNFCNMLNHSTPSAVEYFKQTKRPAKRMQKPVIKKKIYESHYFKDTVYVNPNIQAMIEKINKVNRNSARKIRDFIDNLTM